MIEAVYQIAGKSIRIVSSHEKVHRYCRDYQLPGETCHNQDLTVVISQEEINYERCQYLKMAKHEGLEIVEQNDGYLEELAVYRKIAEWMPLQDTFLFHGSAVAVNNQTYLFAARPGTGKSTQSRLWRELLGKKAIMVNDDKPLIHVDSCGNAIVYGTPWNGTYRLSTDIAVPLKTICMLERAKENRIEEISKKEIYPLLLQQTYHPSDQMAMVRTLQLIERINLRYYRLGCNMDISAAKLAYETMSMK